MLQAITDGLLMGGMYALAAMGLSLIFGVMRITNFAHGAFMTLGMYGGYLFNRVTGLPPYFALPAVWAVTLPLGYFIRYYLIEKNKYGNSSYNLMITLGVSYIIENVIRAVFGAGYKNTDSPGLSEAFYLCGMAISPARLFGFAASFAIALFLCLFLYKSKTGRAVRGCADNIKGAMVCGIDIRKVTSLTFGIGLMLTAAAGVFLSPVMSVYPSAGSFLQLRCFVIGVLGGMGSVIGSLLSGLAVGITESVTAFYFGGSISELAVYLLFVAILLLRPRGIFGKKNRRGGEGENALYDLKRRKSRISKFINDNKIYVAAATVSFLILFPAFSGRYVLRLAEMVFITVLLSQSWNVMSGSAGLFSFGHALFFGLGAYFTAFFATEFNMPLAGMAVGVTVSFLFGGLFCLVSCKYRLKGDYFALTTLALAEIARTVFNSLDTFGGAAGITVPLDVKGGDLTDIFFYYVLLTVSLLVTLAVWKMSRSPFGKRLTAIRCHEGAAEAIGIDSFSCKMKAVASSGGLGGLAGCFYVMVFGYIDPSVAFAASVSVSAIVPAVIGGGGAFGIGLGALFAVALDEICSSLFVSAGGVNMIVYGIIIIFAVLSRGRRGKDAS